jgi:hypothetical protein
MNDFLSNNRRQQVCLPAMCRGAPWQQNVWSGDGMIEREVGTDFVSNPVSGWHRA